MPISVLHVKTCTVADGTATELVRPSDWNSAHTATISLDSNEVIRGVSAGTSAISKGSLNFVNSNGVSWGMSTNAAGGTITASTSDTVTVAGNPVEFVLNPGGGASGFSTASSGSGIVKATPVVVEKAVSYNGGLMVPIQIGATALIATTVGGYTKTVGVTLSFGLYSQNAGSALLVSSWYITGSLQQTRSAASASGSFSLAFAGWSLSTSHSGNGISTRVFNLSLPFSGSMGPGNWWLATQAVFNSTLTGFLVGVGGVAPSAVSTLNGGAGNTTTAVYATPRCPITAAWSSSLPGSLAIAAVQTGSFPLATLF